MARTTTPRCKAPMRRGRSCARPADHPGQHLSAAAVEHLKNLNKQWRADHPDYYRKNTCRMMSYIRLEDRKGKILYTSDALDDEILALYRQLGDDDSFQFYLVGAEVCDAHGVIDPAKVRQAMINALTVALIDQPGTS